MNLHLNKELFSQMIDTINIRTKISVDILEKDIDLTVKVLSEETNTQNIKSM